MRCGQIHAAPALGAPAEVRVAVEHEVSVPDAERPGGGAGHERASKRRDRAVGSEDAVRRVVAERGGRETRLLALDPHAVENAEGSRTLDHLRARRAHRDRPFTRSLP